MLTVAHIIKPVQELLLHLDIACHVTVLILGLLTQIRSVLLTVRLLFRLVRFNQNLERNYGSLAAFILPRDRPTLYFAAS